MIVQILLFAIVGIAVHKYEAWLESEEIFKAQTEGERKISFKTHKPEPNIIFLTIFDNNPSKKLIHARHNLEDKSTRNKEDQLKTSVNL